MRNIGFILAGLFLLNGCASIGQVRTWDESFTHHIKVTSGPSGAKVYINDVLAGITPCENLPVTITAHAASDFTGNIDRAVREDKFIRISKDGYKDAAEPVKLIKGGKYHFVLEPNPQVAQDSPSGEISKAEEIGKYKELLDKGAITKEEFEQKKKVARFVNPR